MSASTIFASTVTRLAQPLEPQPTGQTPQCPRIEGIAAVIFDVYGTLLISGSGDVGVASESSKPQALVDALAAVGLTFTGDGATGLNDLHAAIAADHQTRREQDGIDFPEVRITDIWQEVLEQWQARGELSGELLPDVVSQLAIEYEMRVNPVWPMPGLVDTLDQLREAGQTLGIVSNAQHFTPRLFEPLTGRAIDSFDFVPELCFWSYEHRRAKPGTWLYEQAADVLVACGISPEQALYVGNDMRNDIWPASQVGFRTALFAGDARSLRLRENDPDVAAVTPDVVVTELGQLLDVVKS